jgi:hypothetical protein
MIKWRSAGVTCINLMEVSSDMRYGSDAKRQGQSRKQVRMAGDGGKRRVSASKDRFDASPAPPKAQQGVEAPLSAL